MESASNGAEGLAALERVQPPAGLADMRMPVLDGWDFARILHERGVDLPILVMTGGPGRPPLGAGDRRGGLYR